MATKKGSIQLYQAISGALISEIESAHYLAINDLAVHEDLVATGGKDTKVRVWIFGDLLCHSRHPCRHYHEFGEAQMEITAVKFAQMTAQRIFTTSLDKACRVYDVASKLMIKQIVAQASVLYLNVDVTETYVYLACDNLNVYQVPIKEPSQKKTMTHKKRITALCLSSDGQRLVTGDQGGLIYIWNLTTDDLQLKTFELHKDKGAITNLIALKRPLSLFGLTANMAAYEPNSMKALAR